MKAVRRSLRPLRRGSRVLLRGTATYLFVAAVRALRWACLLPRGAKLDDATPPYILIIQLTPLLGDTILLMPLIERLRAANPQARIEYVAEVTAAPLLQAMPALDRVHTLRLGGTMPYGYVQSVQWALRVAWCYWRQLRTLRPQICLLPRWGDDPYRSALLAYLLDAPCRVGFASDVLSVDHRARYRDALLTQVVSGGNGLHEPVRFCLPARDVGLMSAQDAMQAGTGVVASLLAIAEGVDWPRLARRVGVHEGQGFAVIAPGSSQANKTWPLARWLPAIAELQSAGLTVVLLSGPKDAGHAIKLHELVEGRAVLAAGVTTLIESLALIAHATVFLGNDSGPGHMAGALGVPTVVLFSGAADAHPDGACMAERIRPIGPHVFCVRPARTEPPCSGSCQEQIAHCMLRIEPQQAVDALRLALASTAEARSVA